MCTALPGSSAPLFVISFFCWFEFSSFFVILWDMRVVYSFQIFFSAKDWTYALHILGKCATIDVLPNAQSFSVVKRSILPANFLISTIFRVFRKFYCVVSLLSPVLGVLSFWFILWPIGYSKVALCSQMHWYMPVPSTREMVVGGPCAQDQPQLYIVSIRPASTTWWHFISRAGMPGLSCR